MSYRNPNTGWALAYLRKGLPPLPAKVIGKDKLPLRSWKGLQDKLPTEAEVMTWFEDEHPNADVGIVTGPNSGIIVLDVEEEGLETLKKFEVPVTWTVKTARGYHYYFKWAEALDDESVKSTVAAKLGKGFDFRGRKGFLMVPPSKNMHGGRYAWVPGRSMQDIPIAQPPKWLIDLLTNKKKVAVEGYERVGAPVKEKWLSEVMEGVSDGGRHQAMVKLAGWAFSRMPREIAETFLRDWNEKNSPPIDQVEFEFQLSDLRKKYSSDYDKFKEPVLLEQPQAMACMDINDFLTKGNAKIDWLVPGLIPEKSASIIGGMQGLGKSWMTLDLAIEMARGGGNWLGHFPVKGGAVLYIDEESAEQLLKFRLKKLLAGKEGVTLRHPIKLSVGTGMNLSDARSVENLERLLKEIRPSLVVVDSLIRCHGADENSASDMKRVFRVVKALMDEYKTAFVFIDHERKPSQFDSGASQRLRGSSEKAAFIDTLISLRFKEGGLVVEHSKSRYAKPIPRFGLMIEEVGEHAVQVKHLGDFHAA